MLRIISRGLLGSGSSMVTSGFGVTVVETVVRIIRGGRSSLKKVRQRLEENISISIMLIGSNGKELVSPIIRKVSKSFNSKRYLVVRARPKELTIRKHTKTTVEVTNITVRNKRNERD